MSTLQHRFAKPGVLAAGIIFGMVAASATAQCNWSPVEIINHYAFRDGSTTQYLYDINNDVKPRIATDNAGTWIGMWLGDGGTGEIEFARSTDGGNTWDTPSYLHVDLETPQSFLPDNVATAELVYAGNETWVCLWNVKIEYNFTIGKLSDSEVYVSQSTDYGHTWTEAQRLDLGGVVAEGRALENTFSLASDGAGNLVALWMDVPGNHQNTVIVRSSDSGVTWSAPERISLIEGKEQVAGDSRIAYVGNSMLALVFGTTDNTLPIPVKYIYAATSADNGQSWNLSGLLQIDFAGWDSNLGINGSDNTIVIAANGLLPENIEESNVERTINVFSSIDGGTTFSAALDLSDRVLPSAFNAANPLSYETSGTYILTYGIGNDAGVMGWKSNDPGTTWTETTLYNYTPGVDNDAPVLAGGSNGDFVGVYKHVNHSLFINQRDADIQSINSQDAGETWTEPVYVNAGATLDFGHVDDTNVHLGSGGGTIIATWSAKTETSSESNMYARSDDNGRTWSDAQVLPPGSGGQAVYNGDGKWLMHQGIASPPYLVSTDDGLTWSDAGQIGATNVASDENGTMIRWGDLEVGRSTDNGATWQPVVDLGDLELHSITHTGGSNWVAVDESSAVYTSADGGATFTPNGVNANLASIDLSTISTDHNGLAVAMGSRSHSPSSHDLTVESFVLTTTNGGATWSAPVLVHTEHPVLGPEIFQPSLRVRLECLYLGSDTWHLYMLYILSGRYYLLDINRDLRYTLYRSVSTNDANTWTPAENINIRNTFRNTGFPIKDAPIVAAGEDVIFSWQGIRSARNHTPVSGIETDILYRIYGNVPASSAASDWQLFE